MYFFLSVTSRLLLSPKHIGPFYSLYVGVNNTTIIKNVYHSLVLRRAALAIRKDNCIVIKVPLTDLVNYVFMFSGFFSRFESCNL